MPSADMKEVFLLQQGATGSSELWQPERDHCDTSFKLNSSK